VSHSTVPRPKRAEPEVAFVVVIGHQFYRVTPLAIDAAIGPLAWTVDKITPNVEHAQYHVHVSTHNAMECSCRGAQGSPRCKHRSAVRSMAAMFNVALPAEVPQSTPTAARSSGALARSDPAAFEEHEAALAAAPDAEPWTQADFEEHAAHFGQS
jgi:hypothetical protein